MLHSVVFILNSHFYKLQNQRTVVLKSQPSTVQEQKGSSQKFTGQKGKSNDLTAAEQSSPAHVQALGFLQQTLSVTTVLKRCCSICPFHSTRQFQIQLIQDVLGFFPSIYGYEYFTHTYIHFPLHKYMFCTQLKCIIRKPNYNQCSSEPVSVLLKILCGALSEFICRICNYPHLKFLLHSQ